MRSASRGSADWTEKIHSDLAGDGTEGTESFSTVANPQDFHSRKWGGVMFEINQSDEFPFQPSFFANRPFRSYFFVGDTLLLILTLAILGYVIVHYWERLPAVSLFWLVLIGFGMIAIWTLALRCYRRIHESFRSDASDSVDNRSLLGVALSSAAGMIHWGLFFAYMMTGGLLMQLDRVLSGR